MNKPYREGWRVPESSEKPTEEALLEEEYDIYEPVTEDEFFDFIEEFEGFLAEGTLRQFEKVLGEDCKFQRKLWMKTQGIEVFLTVEKQ